MYSSQGIYKLLSSFSKNIIITIIIIIINILNQKCWYRSYLRYFYVHCTFIFYCFDSLEHDIKY